MSAHACRWFPETPALASFKTPTLQLDLFSEEHVDFVQREVARWEVAQWLSRVPHPYPDGGAADFLQHTRSGFEAGNQLTWVVSDRQNGNLHGIIGLRYEGEVEGAWELGYWYAPDAWGRGIASEAAFHVLAFAFDFMEVACVSSGVLHTNHASKRVLEKVGFEGWVEGEIDTAHSQRKPHLATQMSAEDFRAFVFSGGCSLLPQLDREVPVVWVVAAALYNEQDQVLVAQRPEGKAMAGLWEFPGGKMEPNEGPEAALIRELREELGIDVGVGCLAPLTFASFPYPTFHLMMPLYAARKWKGTPTGQEGQALKWVSKAELRDLAMPPADEPLVPVVMDWM